MSTTKQAAISDWFTLDTRAPALLGSQCQTCHSYYFPKQTHFCRNPVCNSSEFADVELSRTGVIWSYTDAQYQPPAPYIAEEPYQPFSIVAVQLEKEQLIVMGQAATGVTPQDLRIGQRVEMVLEKLHNDVDEAGNNIEKVIWKWKPMQRSQQHNQE